MAERAYRRAIWAVAIRVVANAAMLAAACVGMYRAYFAPSEALAVFCAWFFGITVPVWILARIVSGVVRRRLADDDEGSVRLPGRKRSTIVRWRVAEPGCSLLRPGAKP